MTETLMEDLADFARDNINDDGTISQFSETAQEALDEIMRLRLAITHYEAALKFKSYTDSYAEELTKARVGSGWFDD